MASVPETASCGGRSRLQRRRDGIAAQSAALLPAAPHLDRSGGMADPSASRLAHRACRDERAGFRSSSPAPVGEQSRVLRHGVSEPERSARARRALRVGRCGDLELRFSALGRGRRPYGCRHPGDSGAARAGEKESDRQWPRSVAIRHQEHQTAERRSGAPRCSRRRYAWRTERGRAGSEGGQRSVRVVAGGTARVEAGGVGDWRRQLRLVPEERPARAVYLARGRDTDGTRARSRARVSRARGKAERQHCRRRCRLRAPRSTRGVSATG